MSPTKPRRRSRAVTLLMVSIGIVIVANLLSRLALGVFVNEQATNVVYAQDWRLAYDAQMPVYQWGMTLLLRMTGYWVLAPDLAKYVGLIVTAICLYRLGRRMTDTTYGGALAALLAFLIPVMNGDVLREGGQTALLLALTSASALYFVKERRERPVFSAWMPGLAIIWGAGLMLHHAMAAVMIAQLMAWWYVYRPPREDRWPLIKTALMAFLAAAPVYLLLIFHFDSLSEGATEFFGKGALARFRGLADLVVAGVTEGAFIAIIAAIGYFLARGKVGARLDQNTRFLMAVSSFTLALFAVIITLTNTVAVRDPWLVPGLSLLASIAARWLVMGLQARTIRILTISLAVPLIMVGCERALEPVFNRGTGKVEAENLPLRGIGNEVSLKTGQGEVVIATNRDIAATIKLIRPDLAVYSVGTMENLPIDIREILLVSTQQEPRKSPDFPMAGWSCDQPHEYYLPYHLVTVGVFRFEITRCRKG